MAATVNNTAAKAAMLQRLQGICQAFIANVGAFNEWLAEFQALQLTYSNSQTDLYSFIDNGATGSGANNVNDFATTYGAVTVAILSAVVGNMTTWTSAPALPTATLNQMRVMAGRASI